MCEPVSLTTLGWVSLGLTAASGAAAAYSAREQGRYAQKVAGENARRSEVAAADEEKRGKIEAAQHRMKVRSAFGTELARQGSSGLQAATGSSFDVLADTLHMGEAEARSIEADSARRAWGLRLQGQDYLTSGVLERMSARYKSRGTLLATGGDVAGFAYANNRV